MIKNEIKCGVYKTGFGTDELKKVEVVLILHISGLKVLKSILL